MSDEISRAGAEDKDAGVLEETSIDPLAGTGPTPAALPPPAKASHAASAPDEAAVDEATGAEATGDEATGAEATADAGGEESAEEAAPADLEPGADPERSGDPAPADAGPAVPAFPEDPSPEDLARLTSILLAVLFATEDPLAVSRLAHAAGASPALARRGLDALSARIRDHGLPFELLESGGSFRIVTHPDFHPHLLRLRAVRKNERLSPAALETLAIVAYRQPIIRAEIEAIRGVKAGPLLRTLMDRKLVRVAGRSEVPGRPILYGTTREFLDRFGIASPKDLPSLGELKLGQV